MKEKANKWALYSAAIGSFIWVMLSPDSIDSFIKTLSEAGQSQFARDGFIFSLAAIIHSGRMKKEIRSNFETLIVSIDRVSSTLHEDLKKHGERLDGLTNRVDALESAVKVKPT